MDDRGMLIVGRQADLVVFDMERLRDVATYQHPHQLAEGMVYVMVNGRLAIDGGEFTGVWAGDVLRR
jgi:N-acyl-D-amino-acid deacylase